MGVGVAALAEHCQQQAALIDESGHDDTMQPILRRSYPGCRHAVKKGFDHLPSYIAAKLAGYKKAKQHKRRRGASRAGSPSRGSRAGTPTRGRNSPGGIQMSSRKTGSPEDR